MFFPIKLSHLLSAVFVCLVSITEHTTFDGLKLIWIKSGGKGRESVAKERGQAAPALHARGLLWEKELTGRRSAASSSQTTAAQKEETCWGWCDVSIFFHLSSHLSASSFHQTDMRQTRVQHTVFPTFTQIRRHGREIHKKLAGCLHTHKTLKINQVQPSFDGICYLFLSLGQVLMKKNHQLFNGN